MSHTRTPVTIHFDYDEELNQYALILVTDPDAHSPLYDQILRIFGQYHINILPSTGNQISLSPFQGDEPENNLNMCAVINALVSIPPKKFYNFILAKNFNEDAKKAEKSASEDNIMSGFCKEIENLIKQKVLAPPPSFIKRNSWSILLGAVGIALGILGSWICFIIPLGCLFHICYKTDAPVELITLKKLEENRKIAIKSNYRSLPTILTNSPSISIGSPSWSAASPSSRAATSTRSSPSISPSSSPTNSTTLNSPFLRFNNPRISPRTASFDNFTLSDASSPYYHRPTAPRDITPRTSPPDRFPVSTSQPFSFSLHARSRRAPPTGTSANQHLSTSITNR